MGAELWYLSDSGEPAAPLREALARQPGLRFAEAGGRPVLTGTFEVREGNTVLDSFQVEVEIPRASERNIPVVREVAGRIPRIPDRHVNEADGALCVVLPEAHWYTYPEGLSFAEFLAGPLHQHLAGQALVELGEPWPAGEWAHGEVGVLQFYREQFGTEDVRQIAGLLPLLTGRTAKGHWDCPCGSGKRLRKCHGPKVLELRRKLPRLLVDRLLESISTAGQATRSN